MRYRSQRMALMMAAMALTAALALWAGDSGVGRMPLTTITIDGEPHVVRLAATRAQREHGFQHATPEELASEAIYFVFPRLKRPRFHMHNVARPVHIAWIGPDGVIDEVNRMTPGTDDHRPREPVAAALEFSGDHPIAAHARPGASVQAPGVRGDPSAPPRE